MELAWLAYFLRTLARRTELQLSGFCTTLGELPVTAYVLEATSRCWKATPMRTWLETLTPENPLLGTYSPLQGEWWQSNVQKCVALSTTKTVYIAVTEGCKELIWIKRFLKELGIK